MTKKIDFKESVAILLIMSVILGLSLIHISEPTRH